MPKKKASSKGDGPAAVTSINFVEVPKVVNPAMLGAILNIRMVTWKYLNFQVKVRLNSRVFAIEEKIRQHHGGSVHDVFLYNGVVAPDNLLNDPSATLHDAGFEGGIDGEEPEQDVWYDFSPLQTSCPLLMATPNDREQRESPYRSASRMANERRSPSPKRGSIVSYGTTGAGATPVLAKRGSVASMDPSSPIAGSPTVASMSRRSTMDFTNSGASSPSIGPLSRRPTMDPQSDSPAPLASPALKAQATPIKPQ